MQVMKDEESAIARQRMMLSVPSRRDEDRQGACMVPVSFSLLDVDEAGLTVRFVDDQGRRLDLHLNSVVASALNQCMGSAQNFATDKGAFPLS